MGKASSSKKVARAAGTGGGRTNRGRVPWMYYLALAAVVILGTATVGQSRENGDGIAKDRRARGLHAQGRVTRADGPSKTALGI